MPAFRDFITRHKALILYGVFLALLLLLLRWLELRLLVFNHSTEMYIGAIAILFTALGIWLAMKLTRPKEKTIIVEVEKEVYVPKAEFVFNEAEFEKRGLSRRELEVLELMAAGFSNQEIGARLFISLSTVKTHSSNLFEKLDVKRRTQAIERGKKLGLIP